LENNIHKGHRERVRKRFLKYGLNGMEPHNILEMLLFYSIPYKDTNDIAHKLINTFGNLSSVFDAPIDALIKIDGISERSAILIKMIPQICMKYYDEKVALPSNINDHENLISYIGHHVAAQCIGRTVETVFLICLDNSMKIRYFGTLGDGTNDTVNIVCRKIVDITLKHNSSMIIIAHNHPDGFALPSREDIRTTLRLKEILSGISIKLIDHIIVAGDDFVSMAQSGALSDAVCSL